MSKIREKHICRTSSDSEFTRRLFELMDFYHLHNKCTVLASSGDICEHKRKFPFFILEKKKRFEMETSLQQNKGNNFCSS